jgi:hypothetical protein
VADLWTVPNNYELRVLEERIKINAGELPLPIVNGATVTKISGELPPGIRLDGTDLLGTPFEVALDRKFKFVLRASLDGAIQDRTFIIKVTGPDEPTWITNEGYLSVSESENLFVLDNEIVDYQLIATDPDVSAGDTLEYYIEEGSGILPPGIRLTSDGRIVGVVEPLLALDKQAETGGWDTSPYDVYPNDFAWRSDNGFDSYFYDNVTWDFNLDTQSPKKLNRYYQFQVTVSDGVTEPAPKRKFTIYVVGDDFLRADNSIMKVGNGVFKADNTHIRTPQWLTPANLGYKRADNNITLYLDVLDTETLSGLVLYSMDEVNDDGSPSQLPDGTKLDFKTGEIAGYVPYQPAVTTEYKFTIRATRYTGDVDTAFITATVYEDVLAGNISFKVYKLPRNTIDGITLTDGIDDVNDLRGETIILNGYTYRVEYIDESNEDYDEIYLTTPLRPIYTLTVAIDSNAGDISFYIEKAADTVKREFLKRTLIYSDTERYRIKNVYPYKRWRITSATNDIAISESAGGVLPALGGVVEDRDDLIRRIFERADLPVTIYKSDAGEIDFLAADNALTKRARIEKIFYSQTNGEGSTGNLEYTLVDDGKELVILDKPIGLGRNFNTGDTISLSVQEDYAFEKELITNANADINNPSTPKTFTVKILGEVDSTIKWLSPSNLGSIKANFPSTLRVEAETTVPEAKLIYTLIDGKLPNGMELKYDGEIVGKPQQFGSLEKLGLTTFDNSALSFDDKTTSIDRVATFTIKAQDRFGYSAIEQEFTVEIVDTDKTLYSNLYIQPLLKPEQRSNFRLFVNDPTIFPPRAIYRPNDSNFGIQQNVKMLAYAGIETKEAAEFVAKSAKWHRRKNYYLGDVKKAVAKREGTNDVVYEVVYVEVVDPQEPIEGKTAKIFVGEKLPSLTADNISYEPFDDTANTTDGIPNVKVDGRFSDPLVELAGPGSVIVGTRGGDQVQNIDNTDIDITLRDGVTEVNVDVVIPDNDPRRARIPNQKNTVKTDSDAVIINELNQTLFHIANTTNMRESLEQIGKSQRDFLPLWMRTSQGNEIQELDYITAIPLAYCKEGYGDEVLLNVQNALKEGEYDFKAIDFDVDRYILDSAVGLSQESYIVFPNYEYNV